VDQNKISLDMLPPRARELAELIGLPALITLVEARGGLPLHIPKRVTDRHPIAQLIGIDNAESLANVYGGAPIEIPRCETTLRALLHEEIRARRRIQTESQVAREFGMWGRSIRRICAADNRHDDHPDLFGDS